MVLSLTRGFTLVETVVTLFILAIAIVIFAIATGILHDTRDIRYENIALRVAQTKIDELRAIGYDALPPDGTFTDPLLSTVPFGAASSSSVTYNPKMKQISVGVSWLDRTGATRSVTLVTLLTDVGGL